jgi:hypothetical protein
MIGGPRSNFIDTWNPSQVIDIALSFAGIFLLEFDVVVACAK